MFYYYDVEIRGTWSRKSTTRYLVTQYRTRMRRRAQALGGSFDAVCHREPLSKDGRTLGGTFVFRIPMTYGEWKTRQAEHILRALLYAQMCRPPQIKVNHKISKASFRSSAEPVKVVF